MPSRDDIRSLPTERRWIPPSTIRRDALTQQSRNDIIFRRVRGILNKLTPERFAKLSNDLLKVELNSHVILKGVILLIFEKALDEPKYSSMYAQLCKRLSEEAPNFESQKPTVDGKKPESTFTHLLLSQCEFEFSNRSKANSAYENRDELTPEEEDHRQMAKRKMLGNIKFIGELGKLEIVSNGILHRCILELLERMHKGSLGDQTEDIECLCQIMRTCGRILDTDQGLYLMEQYFKRMNTLALCTNLPLRIRFMLRDVIELRQDGWVPRKATSTEGPMPIHQIRNDNDDNPLRGGGGGYHNRRDDREGRIGTDFLRRMRTLDMDSLGSIPLTTPSFGIAPQFNTNGFGTGPPGPVGGYGRHNQRNQPGGSFYPNQNRHQNNYQGKHNQQQHNSPQNYNNNGNKETLRFNKNKIIIGHPEEVSLRPSANSMMFKQPNIPNLPLNNGVDLFPGMPESPLMRATTMSKANPPLLPKDPPPTIVIKQGPVDKRDKARERKDKGPTKEEVMKKMNSLMDEYTSNSNIEDTIAAFKELKIPERFLRYAVHAIYSYSLDRGDAERDLAAKLVAQMRKDNVLTAQQTNEGWKELVLNMAEKESTVPRIASHVAFLTARAITDNLMQLSDLSAVTENGQHYPLFLLTLQQLHKSQGKAALTQIFNDSKINLITQLPEAEKTKERLGEILEDRDLTFLYPLLRIQGDMWRQLESDPTPASLYKWIKEKLDVSYHSDPGFINALMTVLLKYITQETSSGASEGLSEKALHEKELALLQKYQGLLQTFLPTIESQITAVHSLQVFCLSLNFPKGMLRRWFILLYELSIIDEEAFIGWRENVNDSYPGKGDALFQVNAWLTWLAEQSSEEEDDDDEDKADN